MALRFSPDHSSELSFLLSSNSYPPMQPLVLSISRDSRSLRYLWKILLRFHGTCLASLLVAQPWSSGSEVAECYNSMNYVFSFCSHFLMYGKTLQIFTVMSALSTEGVSVNTKVCVGPTVSGGTFLLSHGWLLVSPLEDSVPSAHTSLALWQLHPFLVLGPFVGPCSRSSTVSQAECAGEMMPILVRPPFPGVSVWAEWFKGWQPPGAHAAQQY